jgi:hypothetical protein
MQIDEDDYRVIKEDCINHVQKRVSSRLKDIRTKYSHMETRQIPATTTQQSTSKSSTKQRILLLDGKCNSGSAVRMTKEMEQKFTSLYGNAIREASNQAKCIYNYSQTENYRFEHYSDYNLKCVVYCFVEIDLDEEEAVDLMQKKCCAVFYHYFKQNDLEKQHQYCAKGLKRYALSSC